MKPDGSSTSSCQFYVLRHDDNRWSSAVLPKTTRNRAFSTKLGKLFLLYHVSSLKEGFIFFFSFFCMYSQLDTGFFTYCSLLIFPNFQVKAFWTSPNKCCMTWVWDATIMFNCAIKCKAPTALCVYNVFLCNSHWEAQRFIVHYRFMVQSYSWIKVEKNWCHFRSHCSSWWLTVT